MLKELGFIKLAISADLIRKAVINRVATNALQYKTLQGKGAPPGAVDFRNMLLSASHKQINRVLDKGIKKERKKIPLLKRFVRGGVRHGEKGPGYLTIPEVKLRATKYDVKGYFEHYLKRPSPLQLGSKIEQIEKFKQKLVPVKTPLSRN